MHATTIVGYAFDGAIYCPGCAPETDDDAGASPVFAGGDDWQADCCDSCHWPLDESRAVHGVWLMESRVVLCVGCWIATRTTKLGETFPILAGWTGHDDCDGCGTHVLPQPAEWSVQVGNVGTVYSGTDETEARAAYAAYRAQSIAHEGRASGEAVTLLCDGEPVEETDAADERTDFPGAYEDSDES